MNTTQQFSLRIEPELVRRIDQEAEQEYKTRTELIKEAVLEFLHQKEEQERLKRVAAELWLKGQLSETQLKKVLSNEEINDLTFGKQWIEETVHEIRH